MVAILGGKRIHFPHYKAVKGIIEKFVNRNNLFEIRKAIPAPKITLENIYLFSTEEEKTKWDQKWEVILASGSSWWNKYRLDK